MKEQTFIRNNIQKWERAETIVEQAATQSPATLAEVYVDITGDLSYAQTHYPDSQMTVYLNDLSVALHNTIYCSKREPARRFITYWTREMPQVLYDARRLLLVSLLIFIGSALIGALSQMGDPSYCRLMMGDSYMDMTEANITAGKPMNVYGSMPQSLMFGSITLNNIGVALRVFAMGLLTSIATAVMLFYNGVMIGCFNAFFAQHGLLGVSLSTTMLHGTLELSAIVIAGAAGLALGNGWLFPGTYTRLASFRMGAKRGLKIVISTVPLFIVAGFIESFITRMSGLSLPVRLAIIVPSAAFVLFYYVFWPMWVHRRKMWRHNRPGTETYI